jgi:succinate dehydrogenase / fumarate reductase, membrane anchor subunit
MKRAVTGLRAWLVQRVSAVFMLLFIVFLLGHFLFDRPHTYRAWHDWMLSPAVSTATIVFLAALIAHAWVGLRDVVMDYVQYVAARVFVLALLALGITGLGVWVIRILLLHSA